MGLLTTTGEDSAGRKERVTVEATAPEHKEFGDGVKNKKIYIS